MTRTTALLTLALLGLAGPAMASDIDDIAPASLTAASLDQNAPAAKERERAPARGKKTPHTQTRTTTASKRGVKTTQSRSTSVARRGPPPQAHGHPATPARPHTTVVRPPPRGVAVRPTPVRPGAARPGTVHATAVRPAPSRHVVVTRPGHTTVVRPTTVVRRPVVHSRTVVYHRVYPYHGVFVYGPRPVAHTHYRAAGPQQVRQADLPERAVDRNNSLAIGLKGGSMISSTADQRVYGDPGLGLVGRYRPAESVALELGVQHHAGQLGTDLARTNTQASGSVALFAFPWTRVSPYAIGGVTYNAANLGSELAQGDGTFGVERTLDPQWGLHGGLGVEFALGDNFALDLEGRYIGWIDERQAGEAPGALQATAGMLIHFK